jgi:hypothetical protein
MSTIPELEKARTDMINGFHMFSKVNELASVKRQVAWEQYILLREDFLRKDCESKRIQYIPLHLTLKDYDPYS